MQLALYKPLIPPNTGNIGRLCVGYNIPLLLIGSLGFSLQEKSLRRAGLDYWPHLKLRRFPSFADFHRQMLKENPNTLRILCLSKKTQTSILDFSFQANDIVLFGNESKGFPLTLSKRYAIKRLALPMCGKIRSYNLANAAAMTVFAAYQQLGWQL